MIAPPYSPEFIQLFLPIVRNEEITGRLRSADRTDDVSLFLGEFKGHRYFRWLQGSVYSQCKLGKVKVEFL